MSPLPARMLVILALLVPGACAPGGPLGGPPPTPIGIGYDPVTAADVPALKLNYYYTEDNNSHRPDFEWTFTDAGFEVKKGSGAIPAELLKKLLPEGATAERIEGKWRIDQDEKPGRVIVLTDLKADGKPCPDRTVSLPIYRTAPTVVRVGEPQYVFGIDRK